jgi:hypothetical protein
VQSYYTFIALDIAQQRSRELERRHLLDIALAADPAPERSLRRSTAALIATLSRVSGRVARRLDENANVADALIGRSVASQAPCADSRS